VSGKLVRKLSDGVLPPGRHSALWNRRDDRGRQVPAGIYFYSLTAQGKRRSSRMVVE
jgi:flagellar hook assembly protein FlgD